MRRLRPDPRTAAVYALPILPVFVALVRALVQHRVPLGDNGLITLRANDVLTSHQPWFGTWTSASLSTGVDFNNPLPLHFEWLALFVKPFGLNAGSAMGAASLNIAAMIVAIRQGRHAAGRRGELLMAIACAGLAWSLGSEMLVDVWQPHNLVLPFLAFIACAVALGAGHWASLPWAVAIGSLVVGTHLSFVYMVASAMLTGVGLAWWHTRNTAGGSRRESVRRPLIGTAVVLVATWGQAVWEQFTASGQGNLSRILHAGGSGAEPIGARLAVRLVAQVVAMPSWWLRGSFTGAIPSRTPYSPDHTLHPKGVVSLFPAAIAVVLVLVALVWTIWSARGSADRSTRSLRVVTTVLFLIALLTVTVMPAGVLGLASHQMRWLWPMSAMVTLVLVDAASASFDVRVRRLPRWLPLALLGVAAVVNLPAHDSDLGPAVSRAENDSVRSLMTQLESVELPGPTWFDGSTLQFAEPVSGSVIAALLDHGQPLHAGDPSFARQLGEERRRRGGERYSLQVRTGASATDLGPSESYLAVAETSKGTPVAVVLIDNG